PSTCGHGWTPYSREAIDLVDAGVLVHGKSDGPLSMWLQRLKVPRDFPLHDNATVRGVFDYNTKNIAGRARFQGMLFTCSAYAAIFESTLEKYGAPLWLIGVVYQESGCDPLATSPTGARGLWQFMPESARAYGLKVVDGEIDERLNSVKATDAGVQFLTDLRREVGAWDLALAAYNMGPYGLMGRIVRVGGDVGFWDLVDANLLPDETAGYVPAIEAYALILENLTRLDFSHDGKRLESTAEIIVKPGVRLSLIARAAHTSTLRIRDLNPEFLRDVVPSGEMTARVPDSEAHRAQVFIETVSPNDDRDTCVPEDFDWGARVFETSKYASACHGGGGGGSDAGVRDELLPRPEWSTGRPAPGDAIAIDAESFDRVFADLAPSLAIDVDDPFSREEKPLRVDLVWRDRKAIRPSAIVAQVPVLRALVEARRVVQDVAARKRTADDARAHLERILPRRAWVDALLGDVRTSVPPVEGRPEKKREPTSALDALFDLVD